MYEFFMQIIDLAKSKAPILKHGSFTFKDFLFILHFLLYYFPEYLEYLLTISFK